MIQVGEMFTPIMVRAPAPTNARTVVVHYACTVEQLADQVAAHVEEIFDDGAAAPDPGDLRSELQRTMKKFLGGFVDNMFRGG